MGERKSSSWTEEEVNLLISLRNQGLLASVIAAQLGKTRNAVIGKAYRLKLSKPRQPAKGRRRSVRARPQQNPSPTKIIASMPIPVSEPIPVEGGVSLLDLERHHCRAVVGTGPDGLARYCGAHKEGRIFTVKGGAFDSAYCVSHGDAYYQRAAVIR